MFWERIIVGEEERLLLSREGQFDRILTPGEYHIRVGSYLSLETEKHYLRDLVFRSVWTDYLLRERPDLVERHLVCIETDETQIAMVYVDTKLFRVLVPAKRILFWRDAGSITAEVIDVVAEAPEALSRAAAFC